MSYYADAQSDALETVRYFAEEMAERYAFSGEVSDDLLNDYTNGDSYHHENHVDRTYNLLDAAELLDELHDYKETDYGLWEGLDPRAAIAVQAAYTYGNAVYSMFCDLVRELNDYLYEELEDTEEPTIEQVKTLIREYEP